MALEFKKAVRQKVKLKLAISGPSGSGKTWGALELAKGLGGRVAVLDTENGSAALYADRFDFDHLCMNPPFLGDKFKQAIEAAIAANYDVLIIDSISHEWAGTGGVLDQKTQLDLRGGNQNNFTNWAKPSADHTKFIDAILQSDIHIIATMRSKTEYVMEKNAKGKDAPRKIGLAPIQRDGAEYEFSVVFDVGLGHEAAASKDRSSLFDGEHFRLSPEIGERLKRWLDNEKPEEPSTAEKQKIWTETPTA